jgi:large subunit ribosomal protein L13
MKSQRITLPKTVERAWHEIDASKAPLGRIATRIATLLRGKHKRTFTPHMDMGDFVVVTNVNKLKFTGRKLEQKVYYRHSGYLGGLKKRTLKQENERNPEWVLRKAVREMIDDLKFRKTLMGRLKVVEGTEHTFPTKK